MLTDENQPPALEFLISITFDKVMSAEKKLNTMPPSSISLKIGILGIQGAFFEHKAALLKASALLPQPVTLAIHDVRRADDIHSDMQGLIIPGGESTVISMFLKRSNMEGILKSWMQNDKHVTWGTCAGMILLAEESVHQKDGGQPQLGGLDVVVSRNYFGRQVESFEANVDLKDVPLLKQSDSSVPNGIFRGVFIRAPAVVQVRDPSVTVLATLNLPSADNGQLTVAVQQRNLIATAFHPELTDDPTWHLYFLKTVLNKNTSNNS